ncbi:MAG: S-methyl-5-thioribose-1-phosphate isomerase [Ignavibacteria bacterium]|nr:S-methyl-5-thioribose-1-phosphate isomerase [Ignavibacteria bacterium]
MKKPDFFALRFRDNQLEFIDQTKLPFEVEYVLTDDIERIAGAIERLEIRGAPAIGIAAAFAMALSQKKETSSEFFASSLVRLQRTRPTAVNLFWALDEMRGVFNSLNPGIDAYPVLLSKAQQILQGDVESCDAIAANGLEVFLKPSNVLTHCNTGALALGGGGTALYVIKKAYEAGLVKHVYVDETRPLLQGSRLTAFELDYYGIPFSVITDSMAAFIMKTVGIDLVITGADRIVANGDSANKIGTYNLAIASSYHNVPFYIAAPWTTIDTNSQTGDDIVIEERKQSELFTVRGNDISIPTYPARNPSFDVTPSNLIAGIITDRGLYRYPYTFV